MFKSTNWIVIININIVFGSNVDKINIRIQSYNISAIVSDLGIARSYRFNYYLESYGQFGKSRSTQKQKQSYTDDRLCVTLDLA